MTGSTDTTVMPYRIAVLCYLYDAEGNILLLHRSQEPNRGMYSPVGGKLEVATGEDPHRCALREVKEETGLVLADDDVRLVGIVTETAYQNEAHWLIFLFEATRPIDPAGVKWSEFREGRLEWKRLDEVPDLPIPKTDRDVMWPQVQAHRGGFFTAHIDWTEPGISWTLRESSLQAGR